MEGGGIITMVGKTNRGIEQSGTQPVVTWELFIHYWSNGNLCFLCFRMFSWGRGEGVNEENILWTDKCADSLAGAESLLHIVGLFSRRTAVKVWACYLSF